MTGIIIALFSSLLGVYAISTASFLLFCLATLGIGSNMAFVQQYRFAAAESVEPDYVGRAVSLVLIGGIVAAFLGPELAINSREWLAFGPYSGSFAALAAIYLLNMAVMSFLRKPPTNAAAVESGRKRPLKEIISQPLFLMAAMVAYWCMTFIMTATPVSMH